MKASKNRRSQIESDHTEPEKVGSGNTKSESRDLDYYNPNIIRLDCDVSFKPCVFCGDEARGENHDNSLDLMFRDEWVRVCGACGQRIVGFLFDYLNEGRTGWQEDLWKLKACIGEVQRARGQFQGRKDNP